MQITRLAFLIAILPFITGCRSKADKQLDDSIASIKKGLAYRSLPAAEAYNFVNKCYLPHLDTMQTGRKIFINPKIGYNFEELSKSAIKSAKEYAAVKRLANVIYQPPPFKSVLPIDTTIKWEQKHLRNTIVVSDSTYFKKSDEGSFELKAWRKKYGAGYMCVSWPQYNPQTGRIIISEVICDHDRCGTGKGRDLWYSRTPAGWKPTLVPGFNW